MTHITYTLKIFEILPNNKTDFITSIDIPNLSKIPEIIIEFQTLFHDLNLKFEITQ
jgi:hypothetical protein